MRHVWKTPIGAQNPPLMTEIMRKRAELFDKDGVGTALPPDAKKIAIGIMQLTNSVALLTANLIWIDHDKRVSLPEDETGSRFIATLSGQVMCLVDDECPAMNGGEIWWVDKSAIVLVNKSGDDAVLLLVSLKPE